MKSIRNIPIRNHTVFVRVDFNVPLDDNQNITQDGRIKAALTTIEYLIQKGAKVVIGSHLGRPKGQVVEELRMLPVAKRLHELLGQDIHYVDDCIGEEVERTKERMKPGEVMLLENLRFYDEEQENDLRFAEQLAKGIDVYIADGFGVIHRKHASTFALPSIVFDKGTGFLIEEEIEALNKIVRVPDQPMVLVVGGVKISDKVDVIRNLAPMADMVLLGGGVANTFMKGAGMDIGASLVESDSVSADQEGTDYAKVALDIAHRFETEDPTIDVTGPDGEALKKIVMPVDAVAAPSVEEGVETRVVEFGADGSVDMPDDWMFLDIGPKTQELYCEILGKARTIFWNGPMGLFEMDPYSGGSRAVAEAVAESDGYAVLGGGDTEVVVGKFDLHGRYSHISTGGGASLRYLAQNPLPGLEALKQGNE